MPDITKQFFTFLASERDNAESSFVTVIRGRAGTGKTTDALGIAYTMLTSDPTRFVAISAGPIAIRSGSNEVGRRVRELNSYNDIHKNDIVILDEYPVIGSRCDAVNVKFLERSLLFARHKRNCIIVIAHGNDRTVDPLVHIYIDTIAPGVAVVESTYKWFMSEKGVVTFSSSPFEFDYRRVWATAASILTRDVIACYHCLGIVKPTDEKCPYCGYYFSKVKSNGPV
jgi:hypothetical protein